MRSVETLAGWDRATLNEDGTPRAGLTANLLRTARQYHLLPEAYVLGIAQTLTTTSQRRAYLMGAYSGTGWLWYFPTTFAIKTPLATLGLLAAAIVAVVRGRVRPAQTVLSAGLIAFAAVYSIYVVHSHLNIGQRHLLPLYPLVYVFAGAAAAWLSRLVGRVLVGAAVAWLLAANVWIYPHYLAYFNEFIGGPSRGHLYLADSNLDWGQDLLRLGAYARQFPSEPVKLAYFGSAVPTYYVPCTALPSHLRFGPRAELTAGLYAISATQLVGVYDPQVRDDFWASTQVQQGYAQLYQALSRPPGDTAAADLRQQYARMAGQFQELAPRRLMNRLRHRAPDARLGYSLFVWHLTDDAVQALIRP
jgi:hypothetical protein